MCFGRVPPEINSGRMYKGSGSASMVQAAASWDALAAILRQAAACCRSVILDLAGDCQSAAADATARAMAPYVAWLDATAARAAQAGTQAAAAASAHELAVAALVSPDVIDTNRTRLIAIATTNCLAQASPTVAYLEDEYQRFWADDAEAMYAYARASAKASALTPFSSPPLVVRTAAVTPPTARVRRPSRALTSAADVVSNGKQVMATIPSALKAISSSPQTTLDVHLLPVTAQLSKLSSLCPSSEIALKNLNLMNKTTMLLKAAVLTSASRRSRVGGSAIAAGFGSGESVGGLSVPARWLPEVTTDPVTEQHQCYWGRHSIHLVEATAARLPQPAECPQTSGTHSGE